MAIDYSLETKQGKIFVVFHTKQADKGILKLLGLEKTPTEPALLHRGKACEIIGQLSRSGKLGEAGKKLLFDPFTTLGFSIEIKEIEAGRFLVEGFVHSGEKKEPITKATQIFPSMPPCVQNGPLLQKISSEIDFEWLERVFPTSSEVDKATLEMWLKNLEGEDSSFINMPKFGETPVEIWPVLKLKDRFGAFADLWLDYGTQGEVAIHDLQKASWRKSEVEKQWEKDLLETEFQAKIVETSHYYCPMDRVASSLSFLLDIGWKVLDHQGRRVFKQDQAIFDLQENLKDLVLRGKAVYGEHEVDPAKIIGTFNRRDRFIELSETSVGLLDPTTLPEELEHFEIKEGEARIPREKMGLMQGLFSSLKEEKKLDLHQIFELASGAKRAAEDILPASDFTGVLHPYQQEGLQWLDLLKKQGLSGLLADEMGLGKTIQTLAFFSLQPKHESRLIVVPTSLLFNWQREWEKFLPEHPLYLHHGSDRAGELPHNQTILTSYAMLRQDRELFTATEYSSVILDEAQTIKNPESQVAKIACQLKGDFRLAITGTPLENRVEDLWSIFHFLLPGLLGEKEEFQKKMIPGSLDRRYIDRCRKLIRPFILRRRKDVIADQLPEKFEQVVWVEMEEPQRKIYEGMLAKSRKMLNEEKGPQRMEVLEKILRLRQICCHPSLATASHPFIPEESGKLARLLEDLEEITGQGAKVLVYSQFTSMLALIKAQVIQKGWKAAYLDGETKDREAVVKQFQEDPETQIFLISLKAGGIGLNLTQADYVLLFDPWWNEAVERQAIDRAHRLGRKNAVIARRYITALSVEEKMMRIKEHKVRLAGDLLEEMEETEGFTMDELLSLFD